MLKLRSPGLRARFIEWNEETPRGECAIAREPGTRRVFADQAGHEADVGTRKTHAEHQKDAKPREHAGARGAGHGAPLLALNSERPRITRGVDPGLGEPRTGRRRRERPRVSRGRHQACPSSCLTRLTLRQVFGGHTLVGSDGVVKPKKSGPSADERRPRRRATTAATGRSRAAGAAPARSANKPRPRPRAAHALGLSDDGRLRRASATRRSRA